MAINDLKRDLEIEERFASAGGVDFKIEEVEAGIKKAEENIKIFSEQVQAQIILKAQLEAELARLKSKKESQN